MIQTIFYDPQDYLPVQKIALLGDFNNWNWNQHKLLINGDGIWSIEIDLPPGEYKYKFLVNDIIRLNDPVANLYLPDEKGEITSIIIIDENGDRLFNTKEYTVHIEKYHLSGKVEEKEPLTNKKSFNQTDEKVVSRFEFTKVTGIHTVSVLWFKPDNEFYHISENVLWTADGEENKPIILWFWINIAEQQLPVGRWTIKLFIDGTI